MKKAVVWFLGLGIVLSLFALGIYLLFAYGILKLNHPSKIIYPIQGIDVSHHQGEINWNEVAKDDVQFAFIKATEGGDHKDTQFQTYWKSAQSNGIVVGAYHYYSFCKDPKIQAHNFIATVPASKGTLPPVIDLEYDNNCNGNIAIKKLRQELAIFITLLQKEYGVYPILYCNEQFYAKYLTTTTFSDCPLWIRNTYRQPNLKWTFWQHTAKGKIKGIKGLVDQNTFNGRTFQFETIITK